MGHTNPKMQYIYCGIDSHKHTHTVVFIDCFFDKLGEFTFSSTPNAFDAFYKKAKKFLLPSTKFAWGFEDVSVYGRTLVKYLTAKGDLVKHVNAGLVASERKSQNIPHKTDEVDAECAARVLLSRFDKLPTAQPDDKYFIMKNLVARHQSTVKMRKMLKKQLHGLLTEPYPTYQKFFTKIESSTSLAFFSTYPSPDKLEGVTVEELTTFLKTHSRKVLGQAKATQILNAVKKEGVVMLDYQQQRNFTTTSTIRQLKSCMEEIATIEKQLKQFLTNFDYPLMTLKGIDVVTACRFIAEIGPIERFTNANALARYSGVAPITYASGKSDHQFSSERGNRKLNELFFYLAVQQTSPVGAKKVIFNPLFYGYYHKKMSEGKTKKQALKSVQRRLVNMIYSIMKNKETYINPPVAYVSDTGEIIQ